jgi:hypothetical protein
MRNDKFFENIRFGKTSCLGPICGLSRDSSLLVPIISAQHHYSWASNWDKTRDLRHYLVRSERDPRSECISDDRHAGTAIATYHIAKTMTDMAMKQISIMSKRRPWFSISWTDVSGTASTLPRQNCSSFNGKKALPIDNYVNGKGQAFLVKSHQGLFLFRVQRLIFCCRCHHRSEVCCCCCC